MRKCDVQRSNTGAIAFKTVKQKKIAYSHMHMNDNGFILSIYTIII